MFCRRIREVCKFDRRGRLHCEHTMEPPVNIAFSRRALAAGGAAVAVFVLIVVMTLTTMRSPATFAERSAAARVGGFASDMAMNQSVAVAAAPMAPAGGLARAKVSFEPEQSFRQPATTQSMIIRNAHVEIQVDSLEKAMAAVRRLASSLGGHIGSMNTQTGEQQVRGAVLELRIPSARFDSAMSGMPSFGKVLNSSINNQDVGEEFVDVTARVANSRRLENRLVQLLATRTGKLQDVLTVERELARVRQEIERYEGRLQWIGTQVAMSTISVNVHEKAPIVATPGTHPIGDAFVAAWKNFVRLVAASIAMSGVLIPVAVLAWIGFVIWRRVRGRELAAG